MKSFIFFVCLLLSMNVLAQKDTIEIKGSILDGKTQKPISFVNVGIPVKGIGTVSNDDGAFVFKTSKDALNDTLSISSMGYETYKIALTTGNVNQPFRISLNPASFTLKEVVVHPVDAVTLLTNALHKIPENYETQPVMMKGFYRERVWQSNELISLSEAVISIYKASYTDTKSLDQMGLLKGRKSRDVKQSDLLDHMNISGGLRVDFVKYGVHFIIPDNFKYYNYQLEDVRVNGQDTTYVIDVDQKDGIQMPLLKGKIYIDVNSLAFTGIEYGYSPKGIQYVNKQGKDQKKIVKKLDIDLETLGANTNVQFSKRGNLWYLQSARSEFKARVKRAQRNSDDLVEYRADFIVTEIDKKNVTPIKKEDQLVTFGVDLSRQLSNDFDPAFWENYNYILPEDATKEKAKKIQNQ